jgi:hypothetical protein
MEILYLGSKTIQSYKFYLECDLKAAHSTLFGAFSFLAVGIHREVSSENHDIFA